MIVDKWQVKVVCPSRPRTKVEFNTGTEKTCAMLCQNIAAFMPADAQWSFKPRKPRGFTLPTKETAHG